MQFYVIHKDPATNAKLLPDYAIKRVNVREGWQILSDIGHAVGVTWEGQNKEYNRNHPACMRWRIDREAFVSFCLYYHFCLDEYEIRFKKRIKFHEYFAKMYLESIDCDIIIDKLPKRRSSEQMTIEYLLQAKSKHLSNDEIKILNEAIK